MKGFLSNSLITLLVWSDSFSIDAFFVPSVIYRTKSSFAQQSIKSFRKARPEVGDVVIAEVDDIAGTLAEPIAFFNVIILIF
jgi:hypothetical protein